MTTEIGSNAASPRGTGIVRARIRPLPGPCLQRSPCKPAPGSLPRTFTLLRPASGIARARGFTLMEMLAVIVLIAIATTIAAVSLHGRSRGELNESAQQVAAALRNTRTRAMATGKPQWFTLDLRRHAFTAPGRDPHALPAGAAVDVAAAAEAAGAGGTARIGYFADGSSSGGHITLAEDHRSARIDVDWLTGKVTVSQGVVR